MLIFEATKEALKTSRCIKRKSCTFPSKIKPVVLGDMSIISDDTNRSPGRWWAPLTEDLIAEDWEVVD